MGVNINEQCFDCSRNNTIRLPNGDLKCLDCNVEFACGGRKDVR